MCPLYPGKPDQQKLVGLPDAIRSYYKKIITKINNSMNEMAAVHCHPRDECHLLSGTKAYLSKDTLKTY